MKNKFISTIAKSYCFILLLFCVQSCEQFIDIDLPDDQINTEDVFKDIHTTKAALANLYVNVRQSSLLAGDPNGLGILMGYYTDELISLSEAGLNGYFDFYNNSLQPSNNNLLRLWNTNYTHLYAINEFIEGLSASNYIADNDKTLFLAEAYFLRALYYHYLTQLFGDIPYTTTSDYRFNTTISKTKTEDVLNYVEQDLKAVLETLPAEYRNPERIYPNKAAAELLLAKNYLVQKQYAQAVIFAKNVLDKYAYVLEEDVSKVFKKTAQSTIWQLGLNASGNSTLEAATYIFTGKPSLLYINPELINNFLPQDERAVNWLYKVTDNNQFWFHAFKYKNNENNTDEYSIVFRIEEAYFILIEALAYQNQIPEAVHYLNIIRQRAGLSPLPETLTREEFINEMLSESRNEFFCEHGHRFLDLKRNNLLSLLKTTKSNWEDKYNLLPIPEKEIYLNPNLLPQNNGY